MIVIRPTLQSVDQNSFLFTSHTDVFKNGIYSYPALGTKGLNGEKTASVLAVPLGKAVVGFLFFYREYRWWGHVTTKLNMS